jgi:phytoene dehydrogenase-like protein
MKTLIVEKNAKPGGYCTSFTRKGFTFDACAHSLGSLRKGGNIANVLKELDIDKRINIIRHDPSDIIISSNYRIPFWNNLKKTICEFQEKFPKEAKQIKQFFNYMENNSGAVLIAQLRNKTFKDLLDSYFEDYKLKAVLSLPILGNVGLPPSLASALTAVTIYKEFIYDGGNYPEGGMQGLTYLFAKRLTEFGGNVLLSKMVKKIETKDKRVNGVVLKDDSFISARYVISNADARYTFLDMLNDYAKDKKMIGKLNCMTPSLSMFILYLGIDGDFDGFPETSSNFWFLPSCDIEKMYLTAKNGDVDNSDWFLFRASKEQRNILMLVNASFNSKQYWKNNKARLTDLFIKKVEQVIPDLSKHISILYIDIH